MNTAESAQANEALEAMIAENIIANMGVINLDASDVRGLKECSDFIDGTTADGKLDQLGELASSAISKMKDAHPGSRLVSLLLKIRVADGTEFLMEHIAPIQEVFERLDENVNVKWGIEINAPVPDEFRVCVVCGFK